DRSPDECPEGGGDEDGDGGESGMAAVDVGFDVVARNDFEDGEGGGDEHSVFPTVKDADGEQDGSDCGDGNSDVGNEAAEGGQGSEEDGVRQADEVERGGYEDSEAEVDGE